MKNTEWIVGYPKEGISGPTTPMKYPTVGEHCTEKRNHTIVTCGKETIAIFIGKDQQQNAELLVEARKQYLTSQEGKDVAEKI